MNGSTLTDQATRPAEVAEAARIISGAGLVEAFGHVSARRDDGFMITTTRPLGAAGAIDVRLLDQDGRPSPDHDGRAAGDSSEVPLEAPMHAAIYAARSDVNAICRTHSPAAVRAGAHGLVPPMLHGLGGLAGEVGFCSRTDLVTDLDAGREVAADLAGADCLLIRANGSVATGGSLPEAVVRARYLEERCLVGEGSDAGSGLDEPELSARSRWFSNETARAWAWMRWRYSGDS
jgi:HCOMODA/2-hydroxy-3-carboxy-muconic semialdehyde decarboxylase